MRSLPDATHEINRSFLRTSEDVTACEDPESLIPLQRIIFEFQSFNVHQFSNIQYWVVTQGFGSPEKHPTHSQPEPAAKITGLNSSGTLLCMMGLSLRRNGICFHTN